MSPDRNIQTRRETRPSPSRIFVRRVGALAVMAALIPAGMEAFHLVDAGATATANLVAQGASDIGHRAEQAFDAFVSGNGGNLDTTQDAIGQQAAQNSTAGEVARQQAIQAEGSTVQPVSPDNQP